MKTFFACVTIAIFAVACSGDKEGSAKGGPSSDEIKNDPVKATASFVKAACACEDAKCAEGLKSKFEEINKAVAAKMEKDPEGFKKDADGIANELKKAQECAAKFAK